MHSCLKVTTFQDLSSKEVVSVCDGKRLGYICDLEIDLACGCVVAFLLPCGKGFPFKKRKYYRVDLSDIDQIGEDLILVARYTTVDSPGAPPACGCAPG